VPEEVLMDNPRALVVHHDAASRQVTFNDKLLAFAKHWGFRPRACAPYRARTKGKTENGVGYVKKNAIAGRSFTSWEAFEAHLAKWERDIANVRMHGTTGEVPMVRFDRDEAHRLKPLGQRPSFGSPTVTRSTRWVTTHLPGHAETDCSPFGSRHWGRHSGEWASTPACGIDATLCSAPRAAPH
jgi:hypothetical protein